MVIKIHPLVTMNVQRSMAIPSSIETFRSETRWRTGWHTSASTERRSSMAKTHSLLKSDSFETVKLRLPDAGEIDSPSINMLCHSFSAGCVHFQWTTTNSIWKTHVMVLAASSTTGEFGRGLQTFGCLPANEHAHSFTNWQRLSGCEWGILPNIFQMR